MLKDEATRCSMRLPGFRERFWSKVDKRGECWRWTAAVDSDGYGQIGVGSRSDGTKTVAKAHRVAWILSGREIPPGACVLHSCDNRACVRPDHLWVGSQLDNIEDMRKKGRSPSGSRHWSARR